MQIVIQVLCVGNSIQWECVVWKAERSKTKHQESQHLRGRCKGIVPLKRKWHAKMKERNRKRETRRQTDCYHESQGKTVSGEEP